MLRFAARHGRWCLIAGLVAGLTLPGLAGALRSALPHMIAALLFLAAFRVGPQAILRGLRSDFTVVRLVLIFQVLAPLIALGASHALGVSGSTAALAAVLMLSAPSVTGSPNFALIMGVRPEAALRLLMVGTALLPLTILPVLSLIPDLDTGAVVFAAGRLIVVVGLAGGVAFLLRRGRWARLTTAQEQNLDGASAILLGVVVIGLMSAVGPLLTSAPLVFGMWLAFAAALNFSAQLLAWKSIAKLAPAEDRPAISVVAGNRNIALFLVALSPDITTDLLSFIGCYQIPMYLTPILFQRFYRR